MKHLSAILDYLFAYCLTCAIPNIARAQFTHSNSGHTYHSPNSSSLNINRDIFINGSLIFGGLFPIHYAPQNSSSSPLNCAGKFNIRGFEEALAMIYALEKINNDSTILPGIRIGADIKETCSSVDFAIRKSLNFSFVKRNLEDFACETTRSEGRDSRTVAIIGIPTSDVAMAVTNLAGLFYVPVLSYASSSRLLSNRIRFKYFLRTVSSDTLMARVVVDFLRALQWNFVHILYSDTDYGRSAVETFEHVLAASAGTNICLAVKKPFTKHSNVKEIREILAEIKANQNAKAKAVLLFATIEDAELIVSYFESFNMKDYVFIATDHFTGPMNRFKGAPEMLRRIVGVIPHTGKSEDFMEYLQVKQRSASCPWLDEYKVILDKSVQHSTYVPYVIDAVYAVAHGLHNLLRCTPDLGCERSPDEFSTLNRENGGLLASIQGVSFKGISRDPVSFDSSGNSLGAYDITVVNTETKEWEPIGSWISNTSKVLDIPANVSFLDLNVTRLKMIWKGAFKDAAEPSSLCGQQCPPGHWMKAEERHQSCCWQCVPCTKNEISHNPVNGSCQRCPARYWTNTNHTACLPIIPTAVKLSDPAGISVGVVALLGALSVVFIGIIFFRHGETHIVRASSKVLSYVMLLGILLSYVTAAVILMERTETLCRVVLFSFSISFCMVVATLLTKTNRIHRIFSKRAMRKGTPPCLSDKWMFFFVGCFVAIETAICMVMVLTSPGTKLREVVYSDMKNEAFLQCKLYKSYPNYDMALWWCYNTGLVLVCTYQAYLTRKVPGNYNEARFIAFNMMTISTDVLVFFLSYYGTRTYYKDILVSSFLIVAATVTISCMFLPKVYVILFRPEKNVVHRSTGSLGTIHDEDHDAKQRKISTRSNTSVFSSLSSSSNPNIAVEARHNDVCDEPTGKENTVDAANGTKPETESEILHESAEESCQRPAMTSRESNLSARIVRFEDEVDLCLSNDDRNSPVL